MRRRERSEEVRERGRGRREEVTEERDLTSGFGESWSLGKACAPVEKSNCDTSVLRLLSARYCEDR